MADRIAPKGGYLFEEKDKYRREVWHVFAKQTWPPCAKVGFMPSTEGAEIPIALDLGFKEENLYAIDRSAALLATAPWRKLYPGVKIYGTDVLRSGARLRNDGVQLDCMNMDLCSNLSQPMLDTFTGFINSGCHDGRIVVALTALCGRESTAVDTLANIIMKQDKWSTSPLLKFPKRVAVPFKMCMAYGFGLTTLASGEYKSGKQKMAWGIGEFANKDKVQKDVYESVDIVTNEKLKDVDLRISVFDYLQDYGSFWEFDNCQADIFEMKSIARHICDWAIEEYGIDENMPIIMHHQLNKSIRHLLEFKDGRRHLGKFARKGHGIKDDKDIFPDVYDALTGEYGRKIGYGKNKKAYKVEQVNHRTVYTWL